MAGILRGDIHWADLNPVVGSEQGGFRPVLILSHNVFNDRSGTVIAVAITSQPQRAGFPLTLELSDKKFPKKSWAKISQIRTLSTKRIGKKIASVSAEELVSIIDGLNEIIGG
ncbi:MAG: type II toxin-antitoxin system PemK/MazF family toxin [Desulfobacteraceae bacterium]|jgi:mRNA interferase MazF|nr:type II toxin-antitoxin system PemK/MazF family toxin [Desulfobacteraceae bacterium]